MDTSLNPAEHLLTVARNALSRAVKHKDTSALEHLVAAGWDPMMPLNGAEIESSPLAQLLYEQEEDAARRLIDARSWSSDPHDPFSAVALGMAVCNVPSLVPVLLAKGVSPQTMDPARKDGNQEHSVLALALAIAPSQGVEALLSAGARLSEKERRTGTDPFTLVAKGAAHNRADKDARQDAVVNVLLRHGMKPGPKALRSVLASAVQRSVPEGTLKMWLALGAEINGSDPRTSLTPLHMAVSGIGPRVDVIAALLAAGANPTLKDRWGETPVERLYSQASRYASRENQEQAEALLNRYAERFELQQVAVAPAVAEMPPSIRRAHRLG